MKKNVTTRQDFDEAIKSGKVLVDFWAPWCGPCMMMSQKIDEELLKYSSDITVVKINVDEAPELAAAFGIMSIPALFCYRDGVRKGEFIGVTDIGKIISAF